MLNTNIISLISPSARRLIPKSVFIYSSSFSLLRRRCLCAHPTRRCSTIFHLKAAKSGGKNDFIICDETKKENEMKSLGREERARRHNTRRRRTRWQRRTTARIVTFIYGFISSFISVAVDVACFYVFIMEMRVYHNRISYTASPLCILVISRHATSNVVISDCNESRH